jgi:hypothetical protein
MEDTTDARWIGYWIYELDYGKKAKRDTVKGNDDKNIPIKTIDDLYNMLVKDKEKK